MCAPVWDELESYIRFHYEVALYLWRARFKGAKGYEVRTRKEVQAWSRVRQVTQGDRATLYRERIVLTSSHMEAASRPPRIAAIVRRERES